MCDYYRANRGQFRRQHQAILEAEANLGPDILFPSAGQLRLTSPQAVLPNPHRPKLRPNYSKTAEKLAAELMNKSSYFFGFPPTFPLMIFAEYVIFKHLREAVASFLNKY